MTPLEIEILIHCHVTPAPHPRADALAVREALESFMLNGIIERIDEPILGKVIAYKPPYYKTRGRGRALVTLLCNTPLPSQAWVDKDGKVIENE